jgi:hypothetical protein
MSRRIAWAASATLLLVSACSSGPQEALNAGRTVQPTDHAVTDSVGGFHATLVGFNHGFPVTAQLPPGWQSATRSRYDFDVRSADGTRGVAIMVYPVRVHHRLSPPYREENTSNQYRAKAVADAGEKGARVEPTQLAGRSAWLVDAQAKPGAKVDGSCGAPVACFPFLRSEYAKTGNLGLLIGRRTRVIFGTLGVRVAVWIWTATPGDLPATLREVQPMLDSVHQPASK